MIITVATYRSPLTSLGIPLIAFLLLLVLVDHRVAMPGVDDNKCYGQPQSSSKVALVTCWSLVLYLLLMCLPRPPPSK